jgi:hypothetical protein
MAFVAEMFAIQSSADVASFDQAHMTLHPSGHTRRHTGDILSIEADASQSL